MRVFNRDAARDAEAVGRYAITGEIASGGMATVHAGRLMGSVGFSRVVAIKRMHPHLAKDPEFVAMFIDEARLSARIHHPNVVPTLDVVTRTGELFVVMEYVHGESLATLMRMAREARISIPAPIASKITYELLLGLHAAHEAVGDHGEPLGIVHRDVSPQNVLVGSDGVTRVIDFGIAKAVGRLQTTREGQVKGKLAYISPEQLLGQHVDRRSDIYAASAVLWELLTSRRLFQADTEGALMGLVLSAEIRAPSAIRAELPAALDGIVLRGLDRAASSRFSTAREMATALQSAGPQAATGEVAEWLELLAGEALRLRANAFEPGASGAAAETVSDILNGGEPILGIVPLSRGKGGAGPTAPSKARSRVVWLGALLVSLLIGGATVAAVRARSTNERSVTRAVSVRDASHGESADPAVASSPASLAPSASLVATAAAPSASLVASPTPKPNAMSRPSHGPKAVNCNPPYVVDSMGVRTYKKACLTEP